MKKLSADLSEIKSQITDNNVFLFFDLDGTLTPIRKKPSYVKLSESMRVLLKKAAKVKGISLAIISGRDIKSAKKIVGINGIIYSGNHGMELEKNGKRKVLSNNRTFEKALAQIRKVLKKELKPYKGIIVEDKVLTLSVHYRMAEGKTVKQIRKTFDAAIAPYMSSKNIAVFNGKKVWEIRPAKTHNKGTIVTMLVGKAQKTIPIYFGDDVTDEDAFKAIKGKGIGIKVGKSTSKSFADLYTENIIDVRKALKKIIKLKS
ncbi:MAG: trehalose-phosphatase [Candidatus Omnitrophica bacterium]|nr:trehalose-phosphatase [Candidatus Omnitrophota bacterium]